MTSPARTFAGPLIGVLLVCAAVYGVGSRRMGFFGKDELRYAQIAKEMKGVGGFFVMHYQGELYPDKPPLYFWMARAAYLLTGGVSPLGARLPLIVTTLLTVLVTFDIGWRLFGARAGLLGALFYGLSFQVIWSVHATKLDPPLALFATLAIWFWVRGIDRHELGQRPSFGGVAGFWIAMALGVLAKGPSALAVPLGALLVYYGVRRRWRGAVGWTTLAGLALFLAVVGVWILPALHYGAAEGYLGRIFRQEIVTRNLSPWRHVKEGIGNWVYYLWMIWPEFLPGSLFLPAAFALAWRKRRERSREMRGLLFVLCWFVFGMVLLTAWKSKREQYILPLVPSAGLLIGWLMDRLMAGEKPARCWTGIPFCVLASVGLIVALGVLIDLPAFERKFRAPIPPAARFLGPAVLAAICGAILASEMRGRLRAAAGWSLALVPAAMALSYAFCFPVGYDDRYYRDFARDAEALVGEGGILFTPGKPDPYFNIYGNYYLRAIGEPWTLARLGLDSTVGAPDRRDIYKAFLDDPRALFLVTSRKRLATYRQKYPDLSFHLVGERDIPRYAEHGPVCVVSNRPRAGEAEPGETATRRAAAEAPYGDTSSQ